MGSLKHWCRLFPSWMSWNWISIAPASLQSLYRSPHREHPEILWNTTVAGHFIAVPVDEKHPCVTAQEASLQGEHLGLLSLLPFLCSAWARPPEPLAPQSRSAFHLLSSPSPTAKVISQGPLSWEVTKSTARHASQGPAFSEGCGCPSSPVLTQPAVRAQSTFWWFKCVIIALVPPYTSVRAARTHVPSGSALFTPFCCVTLAKEDNIQLPALSHHHPPQNHHVLDCCFTGAA